MVSTHLWVQNPVGMVHVVAADFNPPKHKCTFSNKFHRNETYRQGLYIPFLRNSLENGLIGNRGLKSTATKLAIPTGFLA
jgi:hypothetical protein